MQYRHKLLNVPARLGLLAGLVVALLLAFGGQPFSLGRSKPIATVGGQGYWLLAKDGGLFAYGDATYLGNNLNSNADIIGIARTPTLRGYWAADDDGTVFPFGDARDYGSRISTVNDIRGFAARPQGDGYWLVTKDGLVIAKGAAAHLGNTPPGNVNQKIVGMEATPSGNGYWIVGRDGGIFAFGDAPFYGSTGDIVLNKPIASMSRTESGLGYRFVANDGGVFNYGDARFYGSTGANPPASTIVDLAATASGSGYWLVAGNGKVYPFGDAHSYGDASNLTLQQPIVGIAATPIVRVNSTPAATNDSATLGEDGTTTVDVLGSDSGLGDGPTSVAITRAPTHGTASVGSDQRITYTPATGYYGSDSLTYKVTDADGESSSATLSFTVSSKNHAPIASNLDVSTNEDTAKSGNVPASDADGDNLSYQVVADPTHGTLTAFNTGNGAFTYRPFANYHGPDSFTFQAKDSRADSNVGRVSITVNAVNDVPVAVADSVITNEDTALDIAVLANDGGLGDGTPQVVLLSQDLNGAASVNPNGSVHFAPNANWNGDASFDYRVTDADAESSAASVHVQVNAVNDAPVAAAGVLTTAEDTVGAGNVSAVDTEHDALTYSIVVGPAHGTLTAFSTATGAYTYTPAANYHGGDSFTFKANDGTVDSNVATVTITVTSVNDAPVAAAGALTTNEDTAGSRTVVATDIDGDVLTYSVVTGPTNGTLTAFVAATGAYTYTPAANYHGADSFTFKANDGTVDSNVAAVTITVTSVNDAPVAANGALTTNEDTAGLSSVVASDTESDPLSYAVVSPPGHGTLTIFSAATGAYTYQPAANYNGGDSFTFKANDGTVDSNVATITISVIAVNDAPVASNGVLATNENTAGSGNLVASDDEGDTLIYSVVSAPSHGTVSALDVLTGAYTYTPTTDYHGGDSFTFKATAGIVDSNVATITIMVNDAPVAVAGVLTTNEDTAGSSTVVATDTEGDIRTYSVVAAPTHGTLTAFDALTGAYTYTPAANYHGGDSFTFKARAAGADSNVAAVTITVTSVNDAPVATATALTTDEDVAGTGTVPVSDVDGGPLAYSIVASPTHGTVTAFNTATGAYTYLPAANYHGGDSFTFKANDGTVDSNVATATITVTSVNDAPVADDFTVSATPGAPATFSLMAHVHDADGDAVTVALTSGTTWGGTITCNASGTCTYTPPPILIFGFDTFTYSVTDPSGLSDQGTVTIDYS